MNVQNKGTVGNGISTNVHLKVIQDLPQGEGMGKKIIKTFLNEQLLISNVKFSVYPKKII